MSVETVGPAWVALILLSPPPSALQVDNFYAACHPDLDNLCLYGNPDGSWEVRLPCDEVRRQDSRTRVGHECVVCSLGPSFRIRCDSQCSGRCWAGPSCAQPLAPAPDIQQSPGCCRSRQSCRSPPLASISQGGVGRGRRNPRLHDFASADVGLSPRLRAQLAPTPLLPRRDGMERKDWLALIAVHSDAWLMSMAYFNAARLDAEGR